MVKPLPSTVTPSVTVELGHDASVYVITSEPETNPDTTPPVTVVAPLPDVEYTPPVAYTKGVSEVAAK
jgi:hypothetical protein